jgi:hypothetical protein
MAAGLEFKEYWFHSFEVLVRVAGNTGWKLESECPGFPTNARILGPRSISLWPT